MSQKARRGAEETSPDDAWEALTRAAKLPVPWVAAIAVVALASLVEVSHKGGSTTVEFRVTSVSAIVVALLWLPTLLRVIALTGGSLKTPAGEASTAGFLSHFRNLPPDQQEESLSAAAAVIDRVETQGPPEQRAEARQVREGIEEAIGEIPRPAGDAARRLREIAALYEKIRSEVPPSDSRTREMTQLVSRARGLASSGATQIDPQAWYQRGSDGARIVALAATQALKDPAAFGIVIDGISKPRSAFEQFHALRAADELRPYLDDEQLATLGQAIRGQLADREGGGKWITPADPGRLEYAHLLLDQISAR